MKMFHLDVVLIYCCHCDAWYVGSCVLRTARALLHLQNAYKGCCHSQAKKFLKLNIGNG
jgi:hypothetical protein